jgi:hypothetical protein
MNLISNCCIVGDLCEYKGIQYFTPFVWNTFFPDDIKILISDYDKINFSKIDLVKYKDSKYYGIRIDSKLTVYYIHYLYADQDGLKRDSFLKEVTGREIAKYIVDSYFRRLSRLDTKEKPKFLFITNREAHANILGRQETLEEWQEIIDLLKMYNYQGIVFTKFDDLKCNENVKIVKITDDNPRVTLEQNIQLIDRFINESTL